MGQVTVDFTIQFNETNDKLRTQVIDYANELNDAPATIQRRTFLISSKEICILIQIKLNLAH